MSTFQGEYMKVFLKQFHQSSSITECHLKALLKMIWFSPFPLSPLVKATKSSCLDYWVSLLMVLPRPLLTQIQLIHAPTANRMVFETCKSDIAILLLNVLLTSLTWPQKSCLITLCWPAASLMTLQPQSRSWSILFLSQVLVHVVA